MAPHLRQVSPHRRMRLRLAMAILLQQQRDLRRVYAQPFCYICGKAVAHGDDLNDDHLPPSGIFKVTDRNAPLILRTHRECNSDQSADDQVIAQLVGPIHGRTPSKKDRPLDIQIHELSPGRTTGVLRGQDLERVLYRWIRGFHAALYGEYLPPPPITAFMTILPFPKMAQAGAEPKPAAVPAAYRPFLEAITACQESGQIDQVVTRNGKCRYSCVWTEEDGGGRWFCIYRLDIYNWSDIGDVNNYERRECVGAYILPNKEAPIAATRKSREKQ